MFYEYDENGLFKQAHALKEGEQFPDNFERCAEIAPPEVGEGYLCRWNGSDWTIENARPQC